VSPVARAITKVKFEDSRSVVRTRSQTDIDEYDDQKHDSRGGDGDLGMLRGRGRLDDPHRRAADRGVPRHRSESGRVPVVRAAVFALLALSACAADVGDPADYAEPVPTVDAGDSGVCRSTAAVSEADICRLLAVHRDQ
jgi:hypothetical protein